jgi:hypothetical protein
MSETPQRQQPNIQESKDIITRTRAKRRFDNGTIDAVAALVSRGLTESEACRLLNYVPKAWFNWKATARHDERFKDRLETFRSQRIEDLIRDVELSSKGVGMKQRDWRASKFLLEILDRQRFNTDKPIEITNQTITVDSRVMDGLKRAYAQAGKLLPLPPANLSAPGEPKRLADAPDASKTVSVLTDTNPS